MNPHPQPDAAAIDEQAASWAARLEGAVLSAAERTALDAWLEKNPQHRIQLSSYCQFSADLEVQLSALVEAGVIVMPAAARVAPPRRRFVRKAALATAAAAGLALCLWFGVRSGGLATFASAGERQAFTLVDGTQVELDAHSTLQFTNRGGSRQAKLTGGEAFFKVTKDHTRPFTVETPGGSVRVTGTTFDVRSDVAAFEVTVIEGSVEVRPARAPNLGDSAPVALVAGDRLLADAHGLKVGKLSSDALDDALAWRQGMAVFVDTPLDAALARFARFQGRSIIVTPAAASQRVGGRYRLDDLTGFISAFEEPLGICSVTEPTGRLRVSLRSE